MASAKLKSSESVRETPQKSPVEIVAPEREKPRNGTQIPCTRPIQVADRPVKPPPEVADSREPAAKISTPTAARLAAISGKCLKSSSTSPLGYLRRPTRTTRSIKNLSPKATTPVAAVARITIVKNWRGDARSPEFSASLFQRRR